MKKVDYIIIGGGVAGMSSAIYAKRFGMDVVIISPEFGGLIATTHLVENFPGFPSVSGFDLGKHFQEHIDSLDVPKVTSKVTEIKKQENNSHPVYTVVCQNGETYIAPTILIATGSDHRKLNVPGEKEFYGKGVSYCATCDGPFFRDKKVGIVGGSDSATKEALYLSDIASDVKIIYRKSKLRAEPINIERAEKKENIAVVPNVNVVEVFGDEKVTGVKLDNGETLELDGLFIEIGYIPQTELAEQIGVELNGKGQIETTAHGNTNLRGVFAAGDITSEPFKQAITSSAQGVFAANEAHKYIQDLDNYDK